MREKGTPQGGVISPLMFNLYLHYAFDNWMVRNYPQVRFVRYADDGLLNCRSEDEAVSLQKAIGERLRSCGLELHPDKTKIVYCRDANRKGRYPNIQFEFLGYTFRGCLAKSKHGKYFNSFSPAVSSASAISVRKRMRPWTLSRWTNANLGDIADKVNASLRGWWSYYSVFFPSAFKRGLSHLNAILVKWAVQKYRRLKGSQSKCGDERTGIFTTGIVSTVGDIKIAIFHTGRRHAGENLQALLEKREPQKDPPIQMSDALSRNIPKDLETILANCLTHARRNFFDVTWCFPDQCGYVIEILAEVYKNDDIARTQNMSW